jgi:nickel-dependent lactate racemase
VEIRFPYSDIGELSIPDSVSVDQFALPEVPTPAAATEIVTQALAAPIGTPRLRQLAREKSKVLLVVDDVSRPTPVSEFIGPVLGELASAGVQEDQIRVIMALGTHRRMTRSEIEQKIGADVAARFEVLDHDWADPDSLEYLGETEQGDPVWINRAVRQSDLVVGLGAIMPLEVCGFTGGGKILVPGLSGEATVDSMHWTRIGVPSKDVLGQPDNPIRASIDALARKAGLDFIVNVVLNARNQVTAAVAGDMVEAHRAGCAIAKKVFGVRVEGEYDIVIADSCPFDIEFWQANKGLDTAGEVVRPGGVVILVSPCREGISPAHGEEILEVGYKPIEEIKRMVAKGTIRHKVVGVHMAQVSAVAVEKARLILVTPGISAEEIERMGFFRAATPQEAFEQAYGMVGSNPSVAVLEGAARMLVLKGG